MRTLGAATATVGVLLALATTACGSPAEPSPSAAEAVTPDPPAPAVVAAPFTPVGVERLLRSMDADLRLAPTTRVDDAGAFPALAFDAHNPAPPNDLAPKVGLVLVYPTTAERVAMQPYFGWSGMSGPGASVIADGVAHSEWIGVENVLVEAVMPGGTLGGRDPTADEARFPGQVRAALEASP